MKTNQGFHDWVNEVFGSPPMAGGSLNHFVHTVKSIGWDLSRESDREDFERQVAETLKLARDYDEDIV